METQIPLLPSENPPNCIPPEKRALTFGGALCSVSAGGEKNKFTSTRCSHDHVSCTHAYVSSSVVSTRFFFQCGNGKCMNWEKKCEDCAISISILFRCRRNAAWQLCKRACLVSPPLLSPSLATNSIKNLIPISGSLAAKVINNFSAK
jgi:hypothetical protein